MDLPIFGVKHMVIKLETVAAVAIRAEMKFLASCLSQGISVLRMRILNFVLRTTLVIFGVRAVHSGCGLCMVW